LAGLLRSLGMAPAVIFGGSGGSRVSLLTAVNHPDVAAGLAMVWISGGVYGLMLLATHYCGESIRAAWQGGMDAVVELPEWAEVLERNPRNRDRFLNLDPRAFIATLERWMLAYCPDPETTVPGLPDAKCAGLEIPTLVFRSGTSDPHHTRATSERVHQLIRGSRLVEPPWGDDEWKLRGEAARNGSGLFERWPLLAPQLLAFFDGA
jgi:pimeloyl-ACP methyl ester carboxylesterase